MNGARRLVLTSLVLALFLGAAGGCGVSEPSTQTFAFTGMGPQGGQVLVGDVLLVIPPGALDQPTAIDVAPQAAPLPITKPGNDPCTYAFLGPIWCCGPVGQDLNVPAFVRLAYDENLIPAGKTEADLVFLIWDDAGQTMRPVTVGVVHNTVGNYFETANLTELGHVAVGVRTCAGPLRPIVFAGGNVVPIVLPSGVAGGLPDGLYLAAPDNSLPPEQIPTEGYLPDSWIPNQDGVRILYDQFNPNESRLLRTVTLDGQLPVTVVTEEENISSSDPLVGWFRDAHRAYFFQRVFPQQEALIAGSLSGTAFSEVPGDGSAPPAHLYFMPDSESFEFPTDIRQSDDGTRVLIQVFSFGKGFVYRIDIVDGTTGELISSDVIPNGGGHATPRFVPGSTDLYVVADDGRSVERYTDAGVLVETIYQLGEDSSHIVDFVLAPSESDRYAAVLEEPFSQDTSKPGSSSTAVTIDGQDTLEVGTLTDGSDGATALGTFGAFVNEMIFHPNGAHVILDMDDVRVFHAADAAHESLLPVASLSDVDVNRTDGRLLLVVGSRSGQQEFATSVAGGLADGLYVASEDGTNLTPVDSQGLRVFSARWLFGIRNAPGMFEPLVR